MSYRTRQNSLKAHNPANNVHAVTPPHFIQIQRRLRFISGANHTAPRAAIQVAIDIKPGSETNPVNLSSRGVLPVAVLTTNVADGDLADFDAADVDPSSLTLADAPPRRKGRRGRVSTLEDVDGDGDLDIVVHFPIADLDLTEQDTEAVLLGRTFDGTPIRGSDTIRVLAIHRFRVDSLRDGR